MLTNLDTIRNLILGLLKRRVDGRQDLPPVETRAAERPDSLAAEVADDKVLSSNLPTQLHISLNDQLGAASSSDAKFVTFKDFFKALNSLDSEKLPHNISSYYNNIMRDVHPLDVEEYSK